MYAIVVPVVALIMYGGAVTGHARLTVTVSVVVGVLAFVGFAWGLWVGYRQPRRAAIAIGGWTVTVVLLSGAVFAMLTWAGVTLKEQSPETAPTSTKVWAAIAAAAVAAAVAVVVDRKADILAGGMAKRWFCPRLTTLFPAQPQAPPQGVTAYRAVEVACQQWSADDWGVGRRTQLFEDVKTAIDAHGYHGGSAWVDAEDPGTAPSANGGRGDL